MQHCVNGLFTPITNLRQINQLSPLRAFFPIITFLLAIFQSPVNQPLSRAFSSMPFHDLVSNYVVISLHVYS